MKDGSSWRLREKKKKSKEREGGGVGGEGRTGWEDGLMARADESKRGRTWKENKAQWWWGVCLAAAPADVVCEAFA